jgi:glutamate-1-semialdehyde aminotransferase
MIGDHLRAGLSQTLKARGSRAARMASRRSRASSSGPTRRSSASTRIQADETGLDSGMGPVGGKLHPAMLNYGVDFNRGFGATWLNGAMTDKDVDQWVDAFDRSLTRLNEDGALV